MAKKDQVSFADLVSGLEKNNLKLNASIQAQLDAQLNTEKVLSDSKVIQAEQAENSLKSTKQDDKLVKDIYKGLVAKSGDGLNSNIIKLLKVAQDTQKISLEQRKDILETSGKQKEFKSIGQRLGGVKEGVKDFFSMRGFLDKTGIIKRGTGGIFSNALDAGEAAKNKAAARIASGERAQDPKTGRTLGRAESEKVFKGQAKEEQGLRRQQGDLTRKIEKYKDAGLNETQVSQTPEYKALLALADKFAKVDPMAYESIQPVSKVSNKENGDISESVKPSKPSAMDDGRITAGPKAPAVDSEEVANEQALAQSQQLDIFKKIEENTRPAQEGGKGESSGGSGIMAGIGKGMEALGKGIGGVGKGIGNALRSILFGLAEGLTALGIAFANPLVTVALAGLTIAAMGIGKALQFAAPAIAAFAPVLMKIAEVIGGVFMAAIKEVPNVLRAVGDIITAIGDSIVNIITAITDSIERLSKIDGTNLLAVGAGLVAVSAGLATFGAANAIAGVGNLVSGFLSGISGQKTPIEQLEQIAGFGPNLNQAGTGVKNLAKGLTEFSSIDTEKIAAISKLPVEKIAAMGAAMNSANAVYDKSGKNKEAESVAQSKSAGATSVVSAPTIVNNKTNQQAFVKSPIRNPDNTLTSYIKTRYN